MASTIRHTEEFGRLFRLRFPLPEETDHYIRMLSQSPEYVFLPRAAELFRNFEDSVQDPGSEKMAAVLQLKEWLKTSAAYRRFTEFDPSALPQFPPGGRWMSPENFPDQRPVLRLDLKAANYAVLKCFSDPDEFPLQWDELLSQLGYPELFRLSKPFRQLVFGYLDSRKIQRIQSFLLKWIFSKISMHLYAESQPLLLNGDEIRIGLPENYSAAYDQVMKLREILEGKWRQPELNTEHFVNFISVQIIRTEKIPFLPEAKVIEFGELTREGFSTSHRSLAGVPGGLYYPVFRQFILNQPVEGKDLFFIENGLLARWEQPFTRRD